jgi:hypothetical protein
LQRRRARWVTPSGRDAAAGPPPFIQAAQCDFAVHTGICTLILESSVLIAEEEPVNTTPVERADAPAERGREHTPDAPERRGWYTPTYEDFDTTPEVTSYSARR